MSCNHQLSMLILVQNKDVFRENKAPIVAPPLVANVLMQYTLNVCLTRMMCVCVCVRSSCHFLFAFVFPLLCFLPYGYMMQVFPR